MTAARSPKRATKRFNTKACTSMFEMPTAVRYAPICPADPLNLQTRVRSTSRSPRRIEIYPPHAQSPISVIRPRRRSQQTGCDECEVRYSMRYAHSELARRVRRHVSPKFFIQAQLAAVTARSYRYVGLRFTGSLHAGGRLRCRSNELPESDHSTCTGGHAPPRARLI